MMTRAVSKTPALALALLILFLVICELTTRTASVRARLLAPSVGSASRLFELQLARLNALVEAEGPVDCIFLGSSLVLMGLDPEAFSAGYAEHSGKRIRCFNFGVPGSLASDVGALAHILGEDYRPQLLFYGVSFRDFLDITKGPGLERLAWVQYRLGTVTLDGWLADNSAAYREYLAYRGWLDPDIRLSMNNPVPILPNGFLRSSATIANASAQLAAFEDQFSEQVGDGRMSEKHLSAFSKLLQRTTGQPQVVIVQVPGPAPLLEWLKAHPAYPRFLEDIRSRAQADRVPFWETWETMPPGLIPDDGWGDILHMNAKGAGAFGRWLGARTAEAIAAGELSDPKFPRLHPSS